MTTASITQSYAWKGNTLITKESLNSCLCSQLRCMEWAIWILKIRRKRSKIGMGVSLSRTTKELVRN